MCLPVTCDHVLPWIIAIHPTEASKLHGKSWNQETVDRYVKVATKLSSLPKTCVALDLMEAHLGRESCLDGITVLRSLASLLA